jgi:hypothetical protein
MSVGHTRAHGLLNDPARYDTSCVGTTTPTSKALR